jgi:hypothetical protein
LRSKAADRRKRPADCAHHVCDHDLAGRASEAEASVACGVRKFDRMRGNRGFAGRTDFTHPTGDQIRRSTRRRTC